MPGLERRRDDDADEEQEEDVEQQVGDGSRGHHADHHGRGGGDRSQVDAARTLCAFTHAVTAIAQRAFIESDADGSARVACVRRCGMAMRAPAPGLESTRQKQDENGQ